MTSAVEFWKTRVEHHHAQSRRIQQAASWSPADSWSPIVSLFAADPHRSDDPVLQRLEREVDRDTTIIDVGGGAGRFALPLALRARQVTVVEPSESMVDRLRQGAQEAGITNLRIIQEPWEEVEVAPETLVLCAHVLYGVAEIEPFIQKLSAHATARVLVLAFMESPLAPFAPFWKQVHGEERIDLPAIPELLTVLWEMDIFPDLEMFEPTVPATLPNREVALDLLRHFLYVQPQTEQDERLQSAMRELLVETPGGLVVRGTRPRRQAFITWRPVQLLS